jgi:hypothetical protein
MVVLSTAAIAGCSTHRVAVTNPCPVVSKQGAVIAAPSRGAIGLVKIGLTPKTLKAQEKC